MEMKRIKGNNYRAVKLRHPTLRNCTYTVQQQSRIYPVPYPCNDCGRKHIFKTFHLRLNEHGEVTVHQQIYETMKADDMLTGLEAVKETTPAPTVLNMAAIGGGPYEMAQPIVFSREEGLIAVPQQTTVIVNAVAPPSGMFRRESDGTWTDLAKEQGG